MEKVKYIMRVTGSNKKARTQSITANAHRRNVPYQPKSALAIKASKAMGQMSPEKRRFTQQLQRNMMQAKGNNIFAATNTANIAAKPEFVDLLPLFTQDLLVPEVAGTIAMNSRQQLVPFYKVKAENTKGVTKKGTVFSSPFFNRNGADPNFTGRIVRNETVEASTLTYTPVLPYTVTVVDGTGKFTDDGEGGFVTATGAVATGYEIDYALGTIKGFDDDAVATYQYDNETVGPDQSGDYGAKMGKIDLELDEILLVARAHELACYYSLYANFVSNQEYGASIDDMTKEAAIGELTAEMNSTVFAELRKAAHQNETFDFDMDEYHHASYKTDALNQVKIQWNKAANAVYQNSRLTFPNKMIVGTGIASYMPMLAGFAPAALTDIVGPYYLGDLDGRNIYVDPNYDPFEWVMACKDNDIRRSSCLYGEYMPITQTDPITLANLSTQVGFASMYDIQVVNPTTVVSGRFINVA